MTVEKDYDTLANCDKCKSQVRTMNNLFLCRKTKAKGIVGTKEAYFKYCVHYEEREIKEG